MGYKLVLAEKPSVAMSIAKIIGANKRCDGYMEGGGYLVSWCIGHLVELAEPEEYDESYGKWSLEALPIVPAEWRYKVSATTKKQFRIIKNLMEREDVTSLVCATDAGREGELIFRLVYHQAECRKPFERLWISSMEDVAIKEGFEKLRPGTEYDALYEAALCRERADWIVGINATRLFSCLYRQTLNVGRVMTPTLAMVVMRDAAINGFRPEPFYTVQLKADGVIASSERMKEKQEAENLKRECLQAGSVTVKKVEQKEKTEKPPLLYDLTSLQREANRQLGYTAQQTLDYTQSLYEKKLVTYPRTDSRFLTEDMAEMLPELVKMVQEAFAIEADKPAPVYAEQVINGKKVTDHHAIIPTKSAVKYDVSQLPNGEKEVLLLIARRLICSVGDPYRYSETKVELSCAGHVFTAKGKTSLASGWKQYAGKKETDIDKSSANAEPSLPLLTEGIGVSLVEAEVKEGRTSAPKRYTEDTLLQSMETAGVDEISDDVERKGIGTPATRAATIEKLVQKGFIERRGDRKTKYLVATEKGNALVTVIPEQIQSSSMTAEWEEKLLKIERGEYAGDAFMREIIGMINDLTHNYEAAKGAEVLMPKDGKVIGNCPACGSPVAEMQKSWSCTGSNCKFAIWKDNNYFKKLGKQMTPKLAEKLIKEGKALLKGCHSAKTGRSYDAVVIMNTDDAGKPVYELQFENGGKKNR